MKRPYALCANGLRDASRPALRASVTDARLHCSHFLVPTMAISQVDRRCACILKAMLLVDRRCACAFHAHVFQPKEAVAISYSKKRDSVSYVWSADKRDTTLYGSGMRSERFIRGSRLHENVTGISNITASFLCLCLDSTLRSLTAASL